MLLRFPSSAHADATTPVGAARCSCRLPSRTTNGLPLGPGGSAPTLPFSRPAQRSIQISACAVAQRNPLSPECFSPCRTLHNPLRLLPTETTIVWVGFASHQENAPFHGALKSGAGALALGSGGLSVAFAPCLQFGSLDCVSSPPLIKPDVRISRIRLTDEITLSRVIRSGISDT